MTTTQIYYAEGFISSWIDHEKGLMIIKTYKLNLGIHAQKIHLANIAAIEKFKLEEVILDRSAAIGTMNPLVEDKWLKTILFPQYKKAGIKRVACIFPKNPIARYSTRNWFNTGKKFGFEFAELSSLVEAYKYMEAHRVMCY